MPEIKTSTNGIDNVASLRALAESALSVGGAAGALSAEFVSGAADELEGRRALTDELLDFCYLLTFADRGAMCPDCMGTGDGEQEPCDNCDGNGYVCMAESARLLEIAGVARQYAGEDVAEKCVTRRSECERLREKLSEAVGLLQDCDHYGEFRHRPFGESVRNDVQLFLQAHRTEVLGGDAS